MRSKASRKNRLPEQFASADQAGDFWDAHDLTDYQDELEPVVVEAELKKRRFEIEVDEELLRLLAARAKKSGMTVERLVRKYLRERIKAAA